MIFVCINNIAGVYPPRIIRHAFNLVKENITYYQLFDGFALQSEYYQLFSYGLIVFGVVVLLLALIKGVFMFLMRQTLIVMSRHIEYDLKNEIYEKYQNLSTAFYKRNQTGDLMSRVSEDVSKVRMFVGPAIMYAINLTVLSLMIIIAMLSVSVKLTIMVLLPLPILSISIYYVNSIINKKSEEIQRQLSEITSVAQETYSGIRVVKSYVQEESVKNHFSVESELYKTKSLSLARVQAMFQPLMIFLIGLSTIMTIYFGGIEVINGTISQGNIAEFVIYVSMLTWPVTAIGWIATIIQTAAASQKRINAFLNEEVDITNNIADNTMLKGGIEFKDVNFVYPDTGIKAINGVSFKINPGDKVAIVGHTGCGKTTIADLLVRMYDVSSGSILLDGKEIEEINLTQLRKQMAYVPQDVFMFSDSVTNNIAFGKNDATEEEIIKSTEYADVFKDVQNLPDKFDTLLGERGVNLSGGQKQRLSLARALVKDSNILILDDCLSAVDAETEKNILYSLYKYMGNKTAIIITHRIASLLDFDQILVFEDGKIIERGTHQILMEKGGVYYDLYNKQEVEEKKMIS